MDKSELDKNALLEEVAKDLEIANQFYNNGNYQECHQIAKKIVPICLQLESWENYIEAKNYMSILYITNEIGVNFEETEKHFVETLKIASQKLDKKSPNLENALMYMEKAIYVLEELNKTDKEKPSITHQISFYNNLGSFCLKTGEREKGFFYIGTALQKCENNDFSQKNQMLSYTYTNLSHFYAGEKDYVQALFYFEQTLAVIKKYNSIENTEIAKVYFEIGTIYKSLKDYKKAARFFQKSLDIRTQFFKAPNSEVASSFLSLGKCMYHQKEFNKAIDYCEKSFAYLVSKFQSQNIFKPSQIEQVTNSSVCLETMQLKAVCLFEIYREDKKGFIKIGAALKILHQAVYLLDEVKKSHQLTQSTLIFLSNSEITKIFNTAMELTLLMNKYKEAFFFCEKNKANLLLTSIQNNLSKETINIPSHFLEKEKDLKSKLTFLEKQTAQEEAKGEEQREDILLQWKSQFFDLHQEYLQLIQQFEQNYPNYYQLKYETQTISIEEIQQNLTDNQVMVNYFIGESHYYLFLISSNDFETHEFEKPENFEALVEGFLEAVCEHQLKDYAEKAYELYQYLLQPIEHHLMDSFAVFGDLEEAEDGDTLEEAKPKELIIIPHGVLSYLPFEALLCSALEDSIEGELREGENAYHHLDYLLLHCEVSYHYSATLWHYLLQNQVERMAVENDFVAFAPVYASENTAQDNGLQQVAKEVRQWATRSEALQNDGTWTPLPHSKVEAEQAAHLFEQKGLKAQTFLYAQATKEQFQVVAERSRFLLVAAHGVVNDAQPKLSGLVFHPAKVENSPTPEGFGDIWNGDERQMSSKHPPNPLQKGNLNVGESPQTDCILSMEETYHLDLKADLVVLSSCESGIGELAKGEGMMAVNRGFLYAGAKNVVSTLFKVYDQPSSLLTQYLFEGVLEGKSYTAALRAAKLRLLKQEEVDVKSWSGFVLIGGGQ